MEGERDREQFKHVCKLCNKRYPSGKSLGGHMRSHVIANSKLAQKMKNTNNTSNKAPTFVAPAADEDEDDDVDEDEDEDVDEDDDDDDEIKERENGGYGLRENPKKTWRVVNSGGFSKIQQLQQHHHQQFQQHQQQQHQQQSQQLQQPQQQQQQERVCKQCGKGFQSLKALCGHMSSHSEKDRNFKVEDDISWSSESHSDHFDHSLSSKRQTRSSMSRYRSITASDSLRGGRGGGANGGFGGGCGGANGGFGGGGGGSSSNNSEIDQQEQEEVAMSLMMLSRDNSYGQHKGCFNLATESSDNNSVILEGGSSSNLVARVGKRKDLNLISSGYNKKVKQVGVLIGNNNNNDGVNNVVDVNANANVKANHQEMDNSDSGYFENGAKELESDDSVDGFVRNCYYYGFNKKRPNKFGFDSSPVSEEGTTSSKKIKQQDYYETTDQHHPHHHHHNSNSQKGGKFECVICNKSFKNHQALGGHIISHRKNGESCNNLDSSKSQSYNAKNLVGTTSTKSPMINNYAKKGSGSKKMKGHKCPYCPKVFKSGQALGGHKRSHMIGGGAGRLAVEKASIAVAPPPPPELELEPELQPEPEAEPEPEQRQQQQPMIDLNLPAPVEEEASGNSHFVANW